MPTGQLIIAVLAHVFVAWLAIRHIGRSTRPDEITTFTSRYDVTLTPATRPIVDHHLHHVRRYRTIGGYVGFMLGYWLVDPLSVDHWLSSGILSMMLVGYLIGAIVAELRRPTVRRHDLHRARLDRRQVGHYVLRRTALLVRLLPCASAVATVAYIAAPAVRPQVRPSGALSITLTLLSVVIAIGVVRWQREIAERAQPVDDDLVNVDTGIRLASMHTVSGAGVALLLLVFAHHAWWLGYYSALAPAWTGALLGVVPKLVAVWYWVLMISPTRDRLSRLVSPRAGGRMTRSP